MIKFCVVVKGIAQNVEREPFSKAIHFKAVAVGTKNRSEIEC